MTNPTQLDLFLHDEQDAPPGFYAEEKVYRGYNICRDCDVRNLCIENKDNWCMKNRCMSYDVVTSEGNTYNRKDGRSVIFKRITK